MKLPLFLNSETEELKLKAPVSNFDGLEGLLLSNDICVNLKTITSFDGKAFEGNISCILDIPCDVCHKPNKINHSFPLTLLLNYKFNRMPHWEEDSASVYDYTILISQNTKEIDITDAVREQILLHCVPEVFLSDASNFSCDCLQKLTCQNQIKKEVDVTNTPWAKLKELKLTK